MNKEIEDVMEEVLGGNGHSVNNTRNYKELFEFFGNPDTVTLFLVGFIVVLMIIIFLKLIKLVCKREQIYIKPRTN